MEFTDRIDALRREEHALADAARAAGLDAPVPTCPEWTVADLVAHMGRAHEWVTRIVTARAPERGVSPAEIVVPEGAELLGWFAGGIDPLAATLAAAGPDAPCWSWTDDRTAGFWARRRAVEAAVHRYDAQLAAGAPEPVEHALAADGVDELFALVPFWQSAGRVRGDGETLHFHCTDGEGEWLVRLQPEGFTVAREHAKGDVAARGRASDLLLFLYGRVAADRLEVFGDASLLARWRELVAW
jgi:uncharacterized protein (TIGR03083 family)